MNPELIDFGAPWPFTVVGGGAVAFVLIILMGGAPALAAFQPSPTNPQLRNLGRMSTALGGIAISVYTVHFLAWGMHGYLRLLAFLPMLSQWSWPVVVTLGLWLTLTGWSVTTVATTWRKPPGDRAAISYTRSAFSLFVAVGLWAWGAFVPVPDFRDYPLPWEAAITANFFLRACYIGETVEALASLLLPLLPPSSGTAHHDMTVRVTDRNATMIPARGRKQ